MKYFLISAMVCLTVTTWAQFVQYDKFDGWENGNTGNNGNLGNSDFENWNNNANNRNQNNRNDRQDNLNTNNNNNNNNPPVNFNSCYGTCSASVVREYNPVCGSNQVTYDNPRLLACAQRCGLGIQEISPSTCVSTAGG